MPAYNAASVFKKKSPLDAPDLLLSFLVCLFFSSVITSTSAMVVASQQSQEIWPVLDNRVAISLFSNIPKYHANMF